MPPKEFAASMAPMKLVYWLAVCGGTAAAAFFKSG
jgi:hypothetical protein